MHEAYELVGRLPAHCPVCRLDFFLPWGMGAAAQFSDVTTPCPRCGASARVTMGTIYPDGAFHGLNGIRVDPAYIPILQQAKADIEKGEKLSEEALDVVRQFNPQAAWILSKYGDKSWAQPIALFMITLCIVMTLRQFEIPGFKDTEVTERLAHIEMQLEEHQATMDAWAATDPEAREAMDALRSMQQTEQSPTLTTVGAASDSGAASARLTFQPRPPEPQFGNRHARRRANALQRQKKSDWT